MLFFGVVFVLYFLKLSDGRGFWYNIRMSDENVYKTAIDYERELKKLNKAELDLKFLFRCREEDLHPKFTRWKNFNTYDDSGKRKRYRKVLSEAISDKHQKVRELRKSVSEKEKVMNETTTFMKRKLIRCAILDVIRRDTVKVKQRHDKKFDSLLEGKKKRDQLIANPNSCIINLTGIDLTQEQCDALQFGLKYSIAVRPRETDLLASAESIWEQLERNNILKDDPTRIQRLKNNLRGLAFNFLNFEDSRIHKDNKRKQIVKNLCENFVILKPDKGGGVVLLQKSDYVQNMESLFVDRTKFKVLDNNPTSTRMSTLQQYLLKLKKSGSISEEEYATMRPKNARPARAFGNPKTHKVYERIPKFRPVIDTTGTSHYLGGKYLSNLLNPLQHNDHTLRETFDAADRIRNIPTELHEDGYK